MDTIEQLQKAIWDLLELIAQKNDRIDRLQKSIEDVKDDINRLREALSEIKECIDDKSYIDAEMIIENALKEPE